MLKKNMSGYDRVFRILLGLIMLGYAIAGRVGAGWGWVGLLLLLTASLSHCPLYALLGVGARKPQSD
ncbi:MAG: DUF2892 domain-containing protein [Leptothrix sp. (in: b-proteobacteria)]